MERSLAALRTEVDAADIRLALLEQYMQLFELYRRQEVFSRNIEESERRLHDIRRMKEEGLITNNDVLRSEMQLTDDRLSLQRTQNDLVLASQHLDILLGLRETLLIRPDTAILHRPIELESYETYIGEAYAGDPDLKRLRMQTELARNDVALARSAIRPDVSLYASNTLARPVARTMEDLYNNNWNVGLSVSVPPFRALQEPPQGARKPAGGRPEPERRRARDAASPPARAHGLPAPPGGRAGGQGPAALGPAGAGELPHHAEPLHEPTGHPDRSAGREQRAARRRTATDGGTHARRSHLLPTAESLRASLTNRPIWETGTENDRSLRKHRLRNILLNAVCVLLAGSGLWATADYFWRHVNYVVTNDAFVDQYVAPLNIRVAGYVREVRFTEHRFVREGDTLLILDDREYRIRVKEAEAALLDARGTQGVIHSGIETSRTNVAVQEANIAEARAKLWQTEQDFRRFERLLRDESVPGQQYEQAKAAYEAAEACYRALVAQKEAARSQYAEASRRTVGAEANILRREADLDMARLNLSYTVLTAPYDGYIGRRTLEPGQFVQAGQTVSYLVRNRDKYITANYKETQIAHIHIGQEVVVKVDAFPGRRFRGRVTAISEATGSKYALVPTDNSAGNFVKVQQRIPVRIDLEGISDEEMDLLRAGMMVETEARRR